MRWSILLETFVFLTSRKRTYREHTTATYPAGPCRSTVPGNPAARALAAGVPLVADWRESGEPFCAAPTRPGSSYCARHQALCIVPKASPEARLREAVLLAEAEEAPEPPPELAH